MILADNPRVELFYAYDTIVIPIKHGQVHQAHEAISRIGQIDFEGDYTIEIKKKSRKRSLDANAYMWVLIGKLGEKLRKPDNEIYKDFVRSNGVFEIIPIKQEAIKRWEQIWKSKGIGWVCDDLGECRNTKGYHNIKCFYGTSVYNTAEMSRLIDEVVYECKEQGIETATPEEIERLKQQWGVSDK